MSYLLSLPGDAVLLDVFRACPQTAHRRGAAFKQETLRAGGEP